MEAVMTTAMVAVLTTLTSLVAVRASAQSVSATKAAFVHVEGSVYLDDKRVQPLVELPTIAENSLIRTEGGRAEVLLAPGVTLRLAENSSIRMIADRANGTQIEVLSGQAAVLTGAGETRLTVVCEDTVTLSRSGAYQFDNRHFEDIGENFCLFKVHSGAGEVQLATLKARLTTGHMMDLNRQCGDHIQVNRFDIAVRDRGER
jgi:hypothetical protein